MISRCVLALLLSLPCGLMSQGEQALPARPEMLILVPASTDPTAISESAVRAWCTHYGFTVLGPVEAREPRPDVRRGLVEDGRWDIQKGG